MIFGLFNISRDVRQGCPLSPYLFILCAEILGNTVRKDNEVHGIKNLDTSVSYPNMQMTRL